MASTAPSCCSIPGKNHDYTSPSAFTRPGDPGYLHNDHLSTP
ncbi:hypothetical protein ACF8LI_24730 [Delftia sp. WSY_12]